MADQGNFDGADDSARTAEELAQAAADTDDRGGRLWRLELAQAFRRLADLGARDRGRPTED